VVQGDEFEVIGRSYVAIYDAKVLEKTGRFYFLQNGDRFHLAKRTALRPNTTMQPLELPAEFQMEKNR
jgi:hypothetical protein